MYPIVLIVNKHWEQAGIITKTTSEMFLWGVKGIEGIMPITACSILASLSVLFFSESILQWICL